MSRSGYIFAHYIGGFVLNKQLSLTLAVALVAAPLSLALPTAGWADSEIPEITVTTRKRSESLQDVPISIAAFTAEDLQRQSIVNMSDVAVNTPGLSIEQQGGGGFVTPVIRGMAQNVIGTDLSYDNNVGIFVNGIYQSGRNSVDMELVGIERIEVARGPQSALYGRSTFAGAINYIYAAPTDEASGSISGTMGSDEDYGATVDLSTPIIGDVLAGRISMGFRDFDGTFKNLSGGENLQGYESTAAAGSLVYTPTDEFTATLNLLYSDRTNEQDAQWLVPLNCGVGSPFSGGAPTYYCGELKAPGDVDLSPEGETEAEVEQYSLNLEYDNDNFTITSITAYTETDYATLLDRDYGSLALGTGLTLDVCVIPDCFTPPPVGPTPIRTDTGVQSFAHSGSTTEDFSQEIRISSSIGDGINWMAGAFYYDSDTTTDTNASLGNSQLGFLESYIGFGGFFLVDDPVTQSEPFNAFETSTESWAVFGQVDWAITDAWTVTAEARYTDEDKETNITYNFAPTDETYKKSFDYVTPRLTVAYTPSDKGLIYGSVAKGVRTGGINGSVTGCSPFGDPPFSPPSDACLAGQDAERFFDEEENWTYEIGSKFTLFDDSLQLNTALYYTDWDDMQLPALNADFFGTHVINVDGGADIWGLEIDGTYLLTDMVTLTAGYAYTDPEFKSGTLDGSVVTSCGTDGSLCDITVDSNGRPAADVGGQTLGRVAEHQASVGVLLQGAFASQGMDWYVQTNVNYQSENYARSINAMEYGERTLVDMRAAIYNDQYEIALWAKNLFDDEYVVAQALQPGFDGNRRIDAYQANGRRFGVTATYSF